MDLRRTVVRIPTLLLAFCALPAALGQKPAVTAARHHCLWQVQGKSNVVYLLGSIHVLKPENYPLPAVIESAYTNSAIAVFETDIGAMDQPMTQLKILAKARLPAGEALHDQLSPALYTSFTNHLQHAGLPGFVFESLKPSMAAVTLAVLDLQKQGLDPEYGLDKHFFARASKEGKEVAALETLDFQVSLLTDCTKEEGELLLKTTLEEIDKLQTELSDMLQAWQTGDADKLEKLLNDASKEAPVIYKRLLTDRSARWVPRIGEWLRGNKNVIVIVGAGHLVGNDGVVELLRKNGAKVTQL